MTGQGLRQLAAECFGTFALVFAGTGAIVINDVSSGRVSHVGIALTFGLIVLAMNYAVGDVSGCHLNPAVTIAFAVAQRFDMRAVLPYFLAQCSGAVLASISMRLLFPQHGSLGATLPAGSALQSLALEFILTAILMFVILGVSSDSKEKGALAGVAIGAVIALEAMFAGPICGASMNPARSIGPALVAWRLEHLWVYIVGPVTGALAGVGIGLFIHGPLEQGRIIPNEAA